MNRIKADSEKLSQIMKTIGQCLNRKTGIYSNVQLIHESGTLTVRATNGVFLGEMSMQVQGEENEIFCVDGDMFSRVINLCKGMIEIISDGKNCVIKGMGRTRLPIINTTVKAPEDLNGSTVKMKAEKMNRRAVGIELKDSYYRQAVINVKEATKERQLDLFDFLQGGQDE